MRDRRTTLWIALLAVTAAAFGGVALDGHWSHAADSEPDPDRLVERVDTDQPEAVDAELEETMVRNGTTVERTAYEVQYRPGTDEMRVRITGPDTDTTLVQNRTHLWEYDRLDDELTRGNRSDFDQGFIVPALEHDHYADLVDEFEVTHEGTDRVAGRDVDVVAFESPEADAASVELLVGDREYRLLETRFDEPLVLVEHRIWIDRDHRYPLAERTMLRTPDGESLVYETEYERVEFEIDDGAEPFAFDPPERVEREAFPTLDAETYDSIEAAREATDRPVPEPWVPEPYRFEEVRITSLEDAERIHLRYAHGEETIRLAISPDADFEPRGASVPVGDDRGVLTEAGGQTWLYWECEGTLHWVNGPIPGEDLVAIAESIDCE